MIKSYMWEVSGFARDGQTWKVDGVEQLAPGDFGIIFDLVMAKTFDLLTRGKAVYGQPGKGCVGPYEVDKVTISRVRT